MQSSPASYLASTLGLLFGDDAACEPWRVPAAQRCDYIIQHEDICGDSLLQKLHFCVFTGWEWVSVVLLAALLLLVLAVLLTTAERFFCPALELISDYMRLPPSVAGATLLSFGNGATDFFTQVAAVAQGHPTGITMALTEPLGGGLFVSNVVFGLVLLVSPGDGQVQLPRPSLTKDLVAYLLALIATWLVLYDAQVKLWEAAGLAAMYAAYVVATFYVARHDEPVHAALQQHEVDVQLLGSGVDSSSNSASAAADGGSASFAPGDVEDALGAAYGRSQQGSELGAGGGGGGGGEPQTVPSHQGSALEVEGGGAGKDDGHVHTLACLRPGCGLAACEDGAAVAGAPAGDGGLLQPLLEAAVGHAGDCRGASPDASSKANKQAIQRTLRRRLQRPIVFVLGCTMPRVGSGHMHRYHRWKALLLPLSIPLFIVATQCDLLLPLLPPAALAYGALCSLLGSAMVWGLYPLDSIPRGTLKGLYAVLTFCLSVVWLNTMASTLVATCALLGRIFGVSPALLGATVLAWGNSGNDLVSNTAMARDGFPTMAVAACFASPIFTMLAGMSCSLALGAWRNGGVLIVPMDNKLRLMYLFATISLLRYLVLLPALKYRVGRSVALSGVAFYVVYNVMYTVYILHTV